MKRPSGSRAAAPPSPLVTPAAGSRAQSGRGADARQLRIIAGQWRGRRWRFPPTGMRPTPDRVRETLFNWLQGRIAGCRCLDLFAGSGALGLEALSRGAAAAVFVEQERAACTALSTLFADWHAEGAQLVRCDALEYLARPAPQPFDVVFVDPPFAAAVYSQVLARLAGGGWLRSGARVYVEQPRESPPPEIGTQWQVLRSGTAGEVAFHLLAQGS